MRPIHDGRLTCTVLFDGPKGYDLETARMCKRPNPKFGCQYTRAAAANCQRLASNERQHVPEPQFVEPVPPMGSPLHGVANSGARSARSRDARFRRHRDDGIHTSIRREGSGDTGNSLDP